jgi:hypothetical protein
MSWQRNSLTLDPPEGFFTPKSSPRQCFHQTLVTRLKVTGAFLQMPTVSHRCFLRTLRQGSAL